jgi:tRNA threonylcarbamoyladenosine biosynthesis protein TsaE
MRTEQSAESGVERILRIKTSGPDETVAFGERIGARLRGGEVIDLSSDLGGGKTTMMRGIARGAGSKDHVASPTFTISKEYDAGKLRIIHFDFYRLTEPGSMAMELADVVGDK